MAGELALDGAGLDIPDLSWSVNGLQRRADYQTLTLITLSSAPVARYLPSGLKQTLRM